MVNAINQKHIVICKNLHTYDATVCRSSWGIFFAQPSGLSVSKVLYWVWNSHCNRMFCMSNRVLRNNNLSGAIPGNLGSSAGFSGANATGDMYVSDHIRLQFSQEIWFSWVIHKLLWPSKLIRHYLDILVFKTWFEDIGLCHVEAVCWCCWLDGSVLLGTALGFQSLTVDALSHLLQRSTIQSVFKLHQ